MGAMVCNRQEECEMVHFDHDEQKQKKFRFNVLQKQVDIFIKLWQINIDLTKGKMSNLQALTNTLLRPRKQM